MPNARLVAVALSAVLLLACEKPRRQPVPLETTQLDEDIAWVNVYASKVAARSNTSADDARARAVKARLDAKMNTQEFRQAKDVTVADYERISTGMTFADVAKIVVVPGKQSSRSSIGNDELTMYVWTSKHTGGSLIVSFINDRVSSKSVMGFE